MIELKSEEFPMQDDKNPRGHNSIKVVTLIASKKTHTFRRWRRELVNTAGRKVLERRASWVKTVALISIENRDRVVMPTYAS